MRAVAARAAGATAANSWVGVGTATGFLRSDWEPVAPVPPLGALSLGDRQVEARPLVHPYVRNSKRLGVLLSTLAPTSARSVADRELPSAGAASAFAALAAAWRASNSSTAAAAETLSESHLPADRDRDQEVAALGDPPAQALPLAPQDEHHLAGQVGARCTASSAPASAP